MIERGVRCVNIYHSGWDAHSNVAGNVTNNARTTDQASAALITDLKRRGLLEDTMVIWGGEVGRTPMVESNPTLNRSQGRDHHPQAFSLWMAGGGVKGGVTLGATDELGFHITERPVHIHDLQATILHLLGLDHERLTFHHGGRDYRLTDVHGKLVRDSGCVTLGQALGQADFVRCFPWAPRDRPWALCSEGGRRGAARR